MSRLMDILNEAKATNLMTEDEAYAIMCAVLHVDDEGNAPFPIIYGMKAQRECERLINGVETEWEKV